jgi:hypothetical protein
MKMNRKMVGWVLVAVFAMTWPVAAQDLSNKIAVLGLRKDVEVPDGTMRTLNEILLNEFHQQGKLEVLGMSDIASMLALEQQRQQFSECDDDSCLAEIGGALGVQLMASSSLGAVGEQYVFNVKIVDVKKARVLSRTSEIMPKSDSELIAGIRKAVGRALAAVVGPVLRREAPLEVDSAPQGPGRGVWGWAPWVSLGVAVVAVGAGGVMGGMALSSADDAKNESDPARWTDLDKKAGNMALGTDVAIGIAGAAAVSTLVLFLVRPDAPVTEAGVTVEPTAGLAPGGGSAGLLMRF